MIEPLLPGAPEPRECLCGRPVPKGPLVHGYGSGCARQHGLLPPSQPRLPRTEGQDGPTLLDLLADVTPPHTSHVSDGQAECTERDRDRGMMSSIEGAADVGGVTTPVEPTPRIAILERYPPRVCAGPECSLPTHVRWLVVAGGLLFGRYWRTAEHIHLCDTHEREAVHLTGSDWDDEPTPARVPAPR